MPAPASSGTALASSGEVVKISRGAGFWVAMGFYGRVLVKSSYMYTFWGYLGSFASSGESRQSSPKLAGAGIQVNRITGQVLI